nr:MAG TPA: head to tail adaptor [Caudoviricetes sp.]
MNLDKIKLSLRITTDAFDEELIMLASAAKLDLKVAGINPSVLESESLSPLVEHAIITYVRLNFGQPNDYERLKNSYDEQKMQLGMSSEFTSFEVKHG